MKRVAAPFALAIALMASQPAAADNPVVDSVKTHDAPTHLYTGSCTRCDHQQTKKSPDRRTAAAAGMILGSMALLVGAAGIGDVVEFVVSRRRKRKSLSL